MRIGIVTSGGGLEQIYLERLLQNNDLEVNWIAFVNAKLGRKSLWETITWFIRSSGLRLLFFKLIFYSRTKHIGVKAARRLRKQCSSYKEVRIEKFSVFEEESILRLIHQHDSQAVLALNLYSIVPETLLTKTNLGFVNVHFGKLPNFKGMSPFLWSLAKGEKRLTSTVHIMAKGIDEGPILEEILVDTSKQASVLQMLIEGHKVTAKHLPDILGAYAKGEKIPLRQPKGGNYFGVADRACLKEIKSNGWKLLKLTDLNFWKNS